MQYENGKKYVFKVNGCTIRVTLENFSEKTQDVFNKTLAYEKLKNYNENNIESALAVNDI